MSETTSWTEHVFDGATWRRFMFMALFTPLLGCVGFMVVCIALFQFFSLLASGESNPQLRALGRDLSRFGADIVAFLTCNTEQMPLSSVPSGRETAAGVPEAGGEPDRVSTGESAGKPASRSRRTAGTRRKRPARKASPRRRSTAADRSGASQPPPAKTDESGAEDADEPEGKPGSE